MSKSEFETRIQQLEKALAESEKKNQQSEQEFATRIAQYEQQIVDSKEQLDKEWVEWLQGLLRSAMGIEMNLAQEADPRGSFKKIFDTKSGFYVYFL